MNWHDLLTVHGWIQSIFALTDLAIMEEFLFPRSLNY